MEDIREEMNHVFISGIMITDFQAFYTSDGKKYYTSEIEVIRYSGKADVIPITVSGRLIEAGVNYTGQYVDVTGQYRSRNYYDNQKRRLKLYVYAREFGLREEGTEYDNCNYIFMDGYICRKPIYRKTPFGRSVTDLLIAVNSPYGRSDYIPCICWGKTAYFASSLPVGSHVCIEGRVQSREYDKQLGDAESEKHVAYEVSISKLERKD